MSMSLLAGAINVSRKQWRTLLRWLRSRKAIVSAASLDTGRQPKARGDAPRKKVAKSAAAAKAIKLVRAPRANPSSEGLRMLAACPGCGSSRLTGELRVLRERTHKVGRPPRITALGCFDCGLVFSSQFPSKEALEKTYSPEGNWGSKDAVKRRHEGLSPAALALVRDVREFSPPRVARPTVLDIGCGVGYVLDAFQHEGYATTGIEPATDVAFSVHTRLHRIPDNTVFDVVVLNHVLEHLDAPFELLATAAHAVQPDGVLVIGTPSLDALPQHGNLRYVLNGGHHLCAFSIACLRTVLRRHGFGQFRVLDRGDATMRMRILARKATGDDPDTVEDIESGFRAVSLTGTAIPESLPSVLAGTTRSEGQG